MNKIAHTLRSSLVSVDRASGALSAGQARELADSIRDTGVPIYAAVLPDDPAYGEERILDRLRAAVDRPGVYAVALGSSYGLWAGGYFGGYGSMLLLGTFLRESMPPGHYDAVHYGDGFGDEASSEAASATEVRQILRGRSADDGETGVDRNPSFDTWLLKARRATCCS
ncbi:hypothetical protein AB0M05_29905 [Streptomyces violaceusniger]|uniref:hypothetical protein n=1 Tax=Streptomyces violaceusniger TaxID=68280 RepID=UPI0034353737